MAPNISPVTLAIVVVLACAGSCTGLASARSAPLSASEMLAIKWVSEAGFGRRGDLDGPAIHAVMSWRARSAGISYRDMMRAYGGRAFNRRRTDRRRWVAWLDPSLSKPRHWPDAEMNWERVGRPLFERRLEQAQRVHEGTLTHQCRAQPHHWGSRTHPRDVANARRHIEAGTWRRVDCGDTGNAYYCVTARGCEPIGGSHEES